MFYMKFNGEKLEIESDNVYTLCPRSGKEHQIDLADVVDGNGELDLYGTAVYCEACTKARLVMQFPRQ